MDKIELNFKKACSECMYFGDENICTRKQEKVLESDCCLHYVDFRDRHSLKEIIKNMVDIFKENE